MKFEGIPQLPSIDITAVAAGKLGRLVTNTVDSLPYFDTGTAWVAMTGGSSGGGGLPVTIGDTPPSSPVNTQLWWNSANGKLNIYWTSAAAWVEAFTGKQGPKGDQGIQGIQGLQGLQGPPGSGGNGPFLINAQAVTTASVRWITYADGSTNLTTLAQSANRGYFIPFTVGDNLTFTRMIINVTTASAGTSYAGIYSDSSGSPGNLLIGTAGLSTGATGDVIATVASTTLYPNTVYWMFVTSSVAATLRGLAVASIMPIMGFTPNAATAITYIYQTVTGAAPATAPTSGYSLGTGTVPIVYLAP